MNRYKVLNPERQRRLRLEARLNRAKLECERLRKEMEALREAKVPVPITIDVPASDLAPDAAPAPAPAEVSL